MSAFWKNLALLALLYPAAWLNAQSPAGFSWLDAVKSPRNQRTLALLRAGPEGFHLLRWQAETKDYTGPATPAYPVLARLNPAGKLLDSRPVPGLEPGSGNTWRFAVSNDSLALFCYETADGRAIQIRVFDLVKNDWSGTPDRLFEAPGGAASMPVWFSRSPDGNRCAVYTFDGQTAFSLVSFGPDFQRLSRTRATWPEGLGVTDIRQVFCANTGDVLVQARTSGSGPTAVRPPAPALAWQADGRAVWPAEDVSTLAPFAATVFLLKKDARVFDVYYPQIGKKYATSFEFAQHSDGPVLCAGFAADTRAELVESYFIYQIDPKTGQSEMLQNAALPVSLRRVFQSEKDASDKKPVAHLRLRRLDWAADGRPWLLAERENAERAPIEFNEAALVRLDSTWKITAARGIEKRQRTDLGEGFFTASLAACPVPKGWWALWHQGAYPNARLMLTECKTSGEPVDHELAGGPGLQLALLPHTQYGYGGKWYFVGESAVGDRFGVGVLEKVGKK